MVQLRGGPDSAKQPVSRNMEEIAAYLHDILEERHSVASDVRLLTQVLDSIKRDLVESAAEESENRPAA